MVGWLCVGFSKIYGNFVMNVELTEKQIFWQKKKAPDTPPMEKPIKTTSQQYVTFVLLCWGGNEIIFQNAILRAFQCSAGYLHFTHPGNCSKTHISWTVMKLFKEKERKAM